MKTSIRTLGKTVPTAALAGVCAALSGPLIVDGPAMLRSPICWGLLASVIPPVVAATLARHGRTVTRTVAPTLALLIAAPPPGASPASLLVTLPACALLTLLMLRTGTRAAPARHGTRDPLSLPILVAGILLLIAGFAVVASLDGIETEDMTLPITAFATVTLGVTVVLGWIAGSVSMIAERKVVPTLHRWWREAVRCSREQR